MIDNSTILDAIDIEAEQINRDYQHKKGSQPPIFIAILNGSFMFCSELLQRINFNCEVSFVKMSSYDGTVNTELREIIGLNKDIEGRDVIVVEDIIETGGTIEHIYNTLQLHKPASIKIATLLFKENIYKKTIPIDYPAIHIDDDFIVGFGLDYDGLGRNFKDVYVIKG